MTKVQKDGYTGRSQKDRGYTEIHITQTGFPLLMVKGKEGTDDLGGQNTKIRFDVSRSPL